MSLSFFYPFETVHSIQVVSHNILIFANIIFQNSLRKVHHVFFSIVPFIERQYSYELFIFREPLLYVYSCFSFPDSDRYAVASFPKPLTATGGIFNKEIWSKTGIDQVSCWNFIFLVTFPAYSQIKRVCLSHY